MAAVPCFRYVPLTERPLIRRPRGALAVPLATGNPRRITSDMPELRINKRIKQTIATSSSSG